MLVLTRREGESVIIGEEVVITILNVRHNLVSIGIDAPRKIAVHRQEIYERIRKGEPSRTPLNTVDSTPTGL
jgi:carbon storage regulator